MNEGSGSWAYDSSGNANRCSLHSATSWVAYEKFPYALHFPGGTDGATANCGTSSVLNLQNFTFEMFFRVSGNNAWGRLAGQMQASTNQRWGLIFPEGKVRVEIWKTSFFLDSTTRFHNDTNWHHVAFTVNGTQVKLYIDGQLENSGTMSAPINSANLPLTIGSYDNGARSFADIAHVRFSNSVRTSFPQGAFAAITNEPTVNVGSVVTPPGSGSPDLVVLNLVSFPNPGGGILIQTTVRNTGTLPTQNGFFTDIYANYLPTGTGVYTGSISFWVNEPITVGATITLTTVVTDLVSTGLMNTLSIGAINESTATLYAQADSTGGVGETDDANNIYSAGTEICLASPDAYEGDDAAETAKSIGVGQTQTHNFDNPGDRDWVKFNAEAGRTYLLQTSNLGLSADTYLYLYDTDRTTLMASNDDYGGSLASQIDWTAPANGTYYVAVQHWNPNAGGCGTSYTLSFAGALSDLVVSIPQPSASPPFEVRQIVNWSVTTTNQGGNTAGASHVGYYLGTACNDMSNRFDNDPVGPLGSGASDEDSIHYIFQPGDVGIRYIIAKADYLNEETGEIDENNNTSCYGPFEVHAFTAPDLVVSAPQPSVSPPFAVDQTVNWSVTTTNQGNEASQATHTGYYLGASCNDEKIVRFDGDPVGPLGSGANEGDNTAYTFVAGDVGTRYAIAWADDLNEEPSESVEHNNRNCYGPFQVQAATVTDLVDSGRQVLYLPLVHLP